MTALTDATRGFWTRRDESGNIFLGSIERFMHDTPGLLANTL